VYSPETCSIIFSFWKSLFIYSKENASTCSSLCSIIFSFASAKECHILIPCLNCNTIFPCAMFVLMISLRVYTIFACSHENECIITILEASEIYRTKCAYLQLPKSSITYYMDYNKSNAGNNSTITILHGP
jgi:hypothetical protein